MSDYYVGEIRMFAGNYAPEGWALCDGQLLDISGNDMLFALLGTTYGGDGKANFALPDMRGRVPVSMGQVAGGSNYVLGQKDGTEVVTLLASQMPAHTHAPRAQAGPGNATPPTGQVWASRNVTAYQQSVSPSNLTSMKSQAIGTTGGSQAHDNMMPFMPLSFIIALEGNYPSPA